MRIVDFCEFVGMAFSMVGAFLMSRDQEKYKNALLMSFYCYLVSNASMLYVSCVHGIGPMFIQMALFAITGIEVISSRTTKKARLLYVAIIAYVGLLFSNSQEFKFEIALIEIVAAVFAVVGNYLFKFKKTEILIAGFTCFFVADAIYIFVACDRSMWFFLVQSMFFIYTSVVGILNIVKTKYDLSFYFRKSKNY